MSRFNNFPASNFMSDFEIVEIQNEIRRTNRRAREIQNEREIQEEEEVEEEDSSEQEYTSEDEKEEDSDTPSEEEEDSDTPINSQSETEQTPINSQYEDKDNDDNMVQKESKELDTNNQVVHNEVTNNSKDDDKENNEDSDQEFGGFETDDEAIKNGSSSDSNTTDGSSNETMHSAKSNDSPVSSDEAIASTLQQTQPPNHMEQQHPLRYVHNNTILFLDELNKLNLSKGGIKRDKTVISAIRTSFQARANNDYFLCHICQCYPQTDQKWEDSKKGHIFPKNIAAIIKHLLDNHCQLKNEARQISQTAETFLTTFKKDMKAKDKRPTYFTTVSIPKSSSTSCLEAAWKSNQPWLTKHLASTYTFDQTKCIGHTKILQTDGWIYTLDLATSVYCTCNSRTIKNERCVENAGPIRIWEHDLSSGSSTSFFNQNRRSINWNQDSSSGSFTSFSNRKRRSINHAHTTLVCPYRILGMPPPNIPYLTHPPRKPKTRSMTSDVGLSSSSQPVNVPVGALGSQQRAGPSRNSPHQNQKGGSRHPRPGSSTTQRMSDSARSLLQPVTRKEKEKAKKQDGLRLSDVDL